MIVAGVMVFLFATGVTAVTGSMGMAMRSLFGRCAARCAARDQLRLSQAPALGIMPAAARGISTAQGSRHTARQALAVGEELAEVCFVGDRPEAARS
jgi:hypothetical protein